MHVLCCLLQRELSRGGADRSVTALPEQLTGTREVVALYPPADAGGRPKPRTTLTETSAEQRQLYELLDLARYAV